jgi:hypothetical protein
MIRYALPLPFLAVVFAVAAAATPQIGASRTALVTVSDSRNQPIVDLGPDDFVVREEGAAREVLSVRVADYPVAVLIDTGSAVQGDFDALRAAAQRFVDRIGPRPLIVGTCGDSPALITSALDEDREQVARRIHALAPARSGDGRRLEAVALAARALRDTGAPFSAVILVASTPADGSRANPDDVLAAVVESGAILHAVVRQEGAESPPGPVAVLPGLVQQTFGQYTPIYAAASYQVALDRIAERMASELLVEYVVPNGSKAGDVRVGVKIPGARVRGLGVRPR